jgi:hypothetical protein
MSGIGNFRDSDQLGVNFFHFSSLSPAVSTRGRYVQSRKKIDNRGERGRSVRTYDVT